MRISSSLIMLVIAAGAVSMAIPSHGAQPDSTAPLAPQLCRQLGGPLSCQIAQPGAWTYRIDDVTFTSEANAYAYMMDLYGPASVFALAYRWGKSNPNPGAPEQDRTIETMSWKMYFRECSGAQAAPCEEFPRIAGYQRVRSIACPAGYQFSNDPSSPYCLPGQVKETIAQTTPRAAGNASAGGNRRPASLR